MKKLIVFIFMLLILASTAFFKLEKNPIWQLSLEKVCFVDDKKIEGLESVQCGDLIFNFCDAKKAKNNIKNYKKTAKNVQFYLKDVKFDEIVNKLKLQILDTEVVDDMITYLAVSPYFDDYINVKNKRINLQIAQKKNEIIIASPAILTGF